MKKEEIIDLLKVYKEKQGKLELKKLEKRRKESQLKRKKEETRISLTQSYLEGGKSNKVNSKVENSVVNKSEEIEELEEEIEELTSEIEDLEMVVEEVNIRLGSLTYLEKEIITAYYIDGFSAEYIGNNTYYMIKHQTRSERTILRIIENILKKIEKL